MPNWKSLVYWGLLLAIMIVVPMRRGEDWYGYLLLFVPLMIAQLLWKRVKETEWAAVVWVPALLGWFIVVVVIHRLVHLAF